MIFLKSSNSSDYYKPSPKPLNKLIVGLPLIIENLPNAVLIEQLNPLNTNKNQTIVGISKIIYIYK